MAYEPQVPLTGQTLGQTRDTIRDNFVAIQTDFNVDHVDFNASGEGKHARVTFPQGTAPSVATNDVVMYAKDTDGRPTIFMRQENNGDEVQLSGPTPVTTADGYTFLPGGLLLQWGHSNATGATTVTFPVAFGNVRVVVLGSFGGGAFNTYKLSTKTNTNFSVVTSNVGTGFDWMALGTIA